MPTIFAIDGVDLYDEDDLQDFADFGAYSSAVSALQTALVALGAGVNDPVLKVLVIDGLIGPKTTAATNRAFTIHIGAGQAPAKFRTGALSPSAVASNASELAGLVNAEVRRRGSTANVMQTVAKASAPKTTAIVPYTSPTSPSLPGPEAGPAIPQSMLAPSGDDTRTQIVKWSAIGLGFVVAAAGVYYLVKGRVPMMSGLDDCCFGDGSINNRERELWINNDEGLYRWYQSERRMKGGLRGFIKRHKDEIDAAIRGVRDRAPARSW